MKKQQEQAAAQAEVMKNLNMTEEQMIAKLQAHPEFVAALQNDPKTLAAIQENPALLLQLVAALPDNKFSNSTAQPSSLLQNHVTGGQGATNQTQPAVQPAQNVQQQAAQPAQSMQQNSPVQPSALQNNANVPAAPQNNEPVRTYIPSSKPFNYVEGDTNTIKQEEITNSNVQAM